MPAAQLCTRINPLFIYNMYFSMKQILFSLLLLLVCPSLLAQDAAGWKALKGPLTFFIANDLGRNGYYEQRPLAELMWSVLNASLPLAMYTTSRAWLPPPTRSGQRTSSWFMPTPNS